ncbi:MAG: hypothetical protein RL020_626 [Pseudomonadota bacterium]|jgi:hypothetical protein
MQSKNMGLFLILALAAALSSGCTIAPAKFSGKGEIASTVANYGGGAKAHFKIKADSCDIKKPKSKFEYSDPTSPSFPNGGVQLDAEIVGEYIACGNGELPTNSFCAGTTQDSQGTVYFTLMRYTSTNAHYPGDGIILTAFQDNGNGKKAALPDQLAVFALSGLAEQPGFVYVPSIGQVEVGGAVSLDQAGPYLGYANGGPLVKGNIKSKHCKDVHAAEKTVYSSAD